MTYKDVIEKILKLDNKIRFVTIADIHGKISDTGHQEGVQNILDFHESQQLLQLAIKSWKTRISMKINWFGIICYSSI